MGLLQADRWGGCTGECIAQAKGTDVWNHAPVLGRTELLLGRGAFLLGCVNQWGICGWMEMQANCVAVS